MTQRTRMQDINIVSNNYSRYGTSVYSQLYDTKPTSKKSSTSLNKKLSTSSLSRKKSTTKLKKIPSYDDNESITTNSSRSNKIKRKYKSLLQSSSKKFINKLYDHHGSSDSFSIFSNKSHKDSATYKNNCNNSNIFNDDVCSYHTLDLKKHRIVFDENFATINDLPIELIKKIISNINLDKDYKILIYCLYLNKKFYQATKFILYQNPQFSSSYRIAQFVTSLRLNPDNGKFVKILNLSNLKNGIISQEISEENINNSYNSDDSEADDDDEPIGNEEDNEDNNALTLTITHHENGSSNNHRRNTSISSDCQKSEQNKDIAYAGWRDWRYRNDPLYSSPVLNSFNLKKVVSRNSSIYSNSSNMTNTTSVSNGNSNLNSLNINNSNRRMRSNSSVSSITSSIMSSLQNTSHISLNSTYTNSTSTTTPSSALSTKGMIFSHPIHSNTNNTNSINSSRTSNSNIPISERSRGRSSSTTQVNTLSKQRSIPKEDESKWYRFKVGYKNKRRIRNIETYNTITTPKVGTFTSVNKQDSREGSPLSEMSRSNSPSGIRFVVNQPFKTNHPYTNKFLLKYAPYRDIPLGYILHILNHCPNLVELNLSNVIICPDFKILHKSKAHNRVNSLVLPAVEESLIMSNSEEDRLDVVYATDSSKNYEQLDQFQNNKKYRPHSASTSNSSGFNPNYWMTSSSANWNDYPFPIDGQTKTREEKRRNNSKLNDKVELKKLNPHAIFEMISSDNTLNNLVSIKMDGAVWCRQYMIKYFILNKFKVSEIDSQEFGSIKNQKMDFSFLKAGMNRNFVWSCKGTIHDFVSLIALDDLLKRDDLDFEEIFSIKSERLYESHMHTRDPDIVDISKVFTVKYGPNPEIQESMNFRITILKSDKKTSYKLIRISENHVSLVIRLHMNENYNSVITQSTILPKETNKRINRLTHGVIARIRSLRSVDLRRNIGENNYLGD